MEDFDRILVGLELDGSGERLTTGSRRALREAAWLAERAGAGLELLHSTWADEYYDPLDARNAVVSRGLSSAGREALEQARDELTSGGLEAELLISEERPLHAFLRRVRDHGVDLVVVAKRDQDDSDGRRLGSVAKKVLRKCPGPVLVVRPEPPSDPAVILAATDLTPVGTQATRYAAWLASQVRGSLHVVHAFQTPMALQLEEGRVSDEAHERHLSELKAALAQRIHDGLAGTPGDAEVVLHIGCTSPSRGILEAVEHLHPSLLVMGTISRAGLLGALVGNTAEQLLDRVDCSILAVKPEEFQTPIRLPDED
jgi:universal stress protein E